jgi:CheY-like chemotaxis protein
LWIVALVLALGGAAYLSSADPLPASATEVRDSTPQPEAPSRAEIEEALRQQAARAAGTTAEEEPADPYSIQVWGIILVLILVVAAPHLAILVIRKLEPEPVARRADTGPDLLQEDPSLAEFFIALRDGPNHEAPGASQAAQAQPHQAGALGSAGALQARCGVVGGQLAELRTLFADLGRAETDSTRLKDLLDLLRRMRVLKENANAPELLPAWQMACALEGLLKQLSTKPSDLNSSVLRTAAGALDLLARLCVPGTRPDLATVPPVRFLAVDDDAVNRFAIAAALKKAFHEPDLAPEGESGIALAAKHRYDVIFLDVEMPGLDGFEVCSKVHELEMNRRTPVVFVTRHSDFESRAKSAALGAQDLIGKPYLAFEITVKALTLVMRGRLEHDPILDAPEIAKPAGAVLNTRLAPPPPAATGVGPATAGAPVGPEISAPAPATKHPSRAERREAKRQRRGKGEIAAPGSAAPEPVTQAPPAAPSKEDPARAFFAHAPAEFQELRRRLAEARESTEPGILLDGLGDLYVGIHGISEEAGQAGLEAISRLGMALETMLKRLLDRPNLCTDSTLDAARHALEALEEACLAQANPELDRAPASLLVVDDDPISRRAVAGALQLVFGRPESAESGEAAVALAESKPFDLIFMDVRMPGMDGFAAAGKIRATENNGQTPVVFVTSQDDQAARTSAAAARGCAFIPKPVLASEIMLVAQTSILRRRMARGRPATSAAGSETASDLALAGRG